MIGDMESTPDPFDNGCDVRNYIDTRMYLSYLGKKTPTSIGNVINLS